jgi:hypothetical protein
MNAQQGFLAGAEDCLRTGQFPICRLHAHMEGGSPDAAAFLGRNPARPAQPPQLSRLQGHRSGHIGCMGMPQATGGRNSTLGDQGWRNPRKSVP